MGAEGEKYSVDSRTTFNAASLCGIGVILLNNSGVILVLFMVSGVSPFSYRLPLTEITLITVVTDTDMNRDF